MQLNSFCTSGSSPSSRHIPLVLAALFSLLFLASLPALAQSLPQEMPMPGSRTMLVVGTCDIEHYQDLGEGAWRDGPIHNDHRGCDWIPEESTKMGTHRVFLHLIDSRAEYVVTCAEGAGNRWSFTGRKLKCLLPHLADYAPVHVQIKDRRAYFTIPFAVGTYEKPKTLVVTYLMVRSMTSSHKILEPGEALPSVSDSTCPNGAVYIGAMKRCRSAIVKKERGTDMEQGFAFAAGVVIFIVAAWFIGTWVAIALAGVSEGFAWLNGWLFGGSKRKGN